jgi:hypothetical protein
MPERTRRELVTFAHPFSLAGVEEKLEPGTYAVETIEEPVNAPTLVAYRRVSTTILLPSPQYGYASKQAFVIDPADLEAARKTDAETTRWSRLQADAPHSAMVELESRRRDEAAHAGPGSSGAQKRS